MNDIEILKKYYGEDFAHMCRSLFPTILETPGLLSKVILSKFAPTKSLCKDLHDQNKINDFVCFINSMIVKEKERIAATDTLEELMMKAGYVLYPECKTEKDIQKFKKYYKTGEELCTFKGGRLNTCRVWFAVKENVDSIKREDFTNPQRQDQYGTSVISIQFSKMNNQNISIKNRYNHTVKNPDATFGNDLDNIIPGLADAFTKKFNLDKNKTNTEKFELNNYVLANDSKFYKYLVKSVGYYYCENNVYLYWHKPIKLEKSKYLLFDEYIIDFSNKTITSNRYSKSSFKESIGEIKNIKIKKINNNSKSIIITPITGEDVIVVVDKHNSIIEYYNPNVEEIGDSFLIENQTIQKISLPKVKRIRGDFLLYNKCCSQIYAPKLKIVDSGFLKYNTELRSLELPNLEMLGSFSLYANKNLKKIKFSKNLNLISFKDPSVLYCHKNKFAMFRKWQLKEKIEQLKAIFKKHKNSSKEKSKENNL